MSFAAERIPAELRERPQWLVWAYERVDGRATKVPRCAREPGRRASTTDPRSWATFEGATQALRLAGPALAGIGFVFAPEGGLVGVDLDLCADGERGALHPDAARIVRTLGGYAEWSPSGFGVHVVVPGELRSERNRTSDVPWRELAHNGGAPEFEVYDRARFFTVTGDALHGGVLGQPNQAGLDAVIAELLPPRERSDNSARPAQPLDVDDEELLARARRARHGADFERLWQGDHGAYGSRSEADLALAGALAFWTGGDRARVDALFRRSGLMRDKWDRKDYREATLDRALDRRDFYTPPAEQEGEEVEPAEQNDGRPFALWLGDFIAQRSEQPKALIGEGDDVILPAAGFLILGGRGGKGKTTAAIDAAFHLASGIDWLGFKVPRALRVLFVENEGPREMFRRKLEAKRTSWPHELHGGIAVYTLDWGALDLRDQAKREALREFVAANGIDLVIADPLDSCGLEGAGSPEDTRRFMELAKEVGLHRDVAFAFLHHPRKERADDELDELAGAWGGRPDTVLMLSLLAGERSRLALPKVRWSSRGKRPALILGFDPDTESFERLAEEGEERDYADEIEELLGDGEWRTVDEIKSKDGGIGAGREHVKETLAAGHPERFAQDTSDRIGRHRNATVWTLARLA